MDTDPSSRRPWSGQLVGCAASPMCDNAAPTRHRRSVERAPELLWEALTPDERHQRLPSSQVEPSSGPPGLRTSTCRSWPTPGTTSCCSTPSTPPGRSNSCSRRSRRCAASRRRRWCASPATMPIRSASRLTLGRAASLCRWSTPARRRRPSCAPAATIPLAAAATPGYAASGASSRITAITSIP